MKISSKDFKKGLRQRVSERAFDLYRESGGQHGNDQNHWLQAEKEILQRGLEVRESGSWLALNASIPDSSADDIQIYLSPSRVMVRAAGRAGSRCRVRCSGSCRSPAGLDVSHFCAAGPPRQARHGRAAHGPDRVGGRDRHSRDDPHPVMVPADRRDQQPGQRAGQQAGQRMPGPVQQDRAGQSGHRGDQRHRQPHRRCPRHAAVQPGEQGAQRLVAFPADEAGTAPVEEQAAVVTPRPGGLNGWRGRAATTAAATHRNPRPRWRRTPRRPRRPPGTSWSAAGTG